MNILELAILKKMVGGGGGSGTDNYNDLSNLPQINGETLAGNKTAENLGLQDALTFDSAPTEDSTNPVESGGVYNALAGKQDNLTFDDDPTENSTNPVKSGGVYSALAGKQDNLTFDGVYNASTNKAATESTVTNAINGLDVSAISVDADETISSISEIDGKISVTKQDIAIASNQVVAMTGYTKPSSAPATPAIQQGDTANAAIGKLEYKADVNQTNILYTMNRVGKNILPIDLKTLKAINTHGTWSGNSYIEYGVTFTINDDCTVSVSGTNSSNNDNALLKLASYLDYLPKINTGRYTLSGCPSGGSTQSYYISAHRAKTTNPVASYTDTGEGVTSEFDYSLASTNQSNISVVIAPSYAITGTIVFSPMLRNASIEDGTYEHYALPNYDLTQLEQQDRNALVEVIDKGAKNRFNFDNWSIGLAATRGTITVSGKSFVITATENDAFTDTWGSSSPENYKIPVKQGETIVLSWEANLSQAENSGAVFIFPNGLVTGNVSTDAESTTGLVFTVPSGCSFITVRFGVRRSGESITYSNIMISTLAEFEVSQNFSDYALPNSDLTRLEAEDRAALAEVVDSGAKQLACGEDNSGTGGTATIQSDGYTVKLTGSASGPSTLSFTKPISISETGTYTVAIEASGTFDTVALWDSTTSANVTQFAATGSANVTLTAGHSYLLYHYAASAMTLYATVKFLVCTLADWKISQKHVPYRMSYQDLCDKKASALINTTISSGSLDDVSQNTFAIYSDNVSNLPVNQYCYVETFVLDVNFALQKAYSSRNGDAYVRVKASGTWTAWKQCTNV